MTRQIFEKPVPMKIINHKISALNITTLLKLNYQTFLTFREQTGPGIGLDKDSLYVFMDLIFTSMWLPPTSHPLFPSLSIADPGYILFVYQALDEKRRHRQCGLLSKYWTINQPIGGLYLPTRDQKQPLDDGMTIEQL